MFTDLIFPGGTVDIVNIPEHHLINAGDVRMAMDSMC